MGGNDSNTNTLPTTMKPSICNVLHLNWLCSYIDNSIAKLHKNIERHKISVYRIYILRVYRNFCITKNAELFAFFQSISKFGGI